MKKKIVAVLLTLMLLLGTGTAALAKNPRKTKPTTTANATFTATVAATPTVALPDKSVYEFKYQLPQYIVAGKDAAVEVTFKTAVLGNAGYEGVRFVFAAQCAETVAGEVTFTARDSAGFAYTFTNSGTWGPPGGFPLPANYSATTNWALNFSKPGKYTLIFKALDGNNLEIAQGIQEVNVTAATFVYTLPETILPNQEVTVNVGFVTQQEYTGVHFAFQKTTGEGDVLFKAQDTNNTWYIFTNSGTWGTSFNITGNYNVTTPWLLTFTRPGTYTITFKLVDSNNQVLAQGSQTVVVKDPSVTEDKEDEDEDNEDEDNNVKPGKTHGLLNALRNHLKVKKNGNPNARARSTARLMELLQSRGMTQEEIESAIKEMEFRS